MNAGKQMKSVWTIPPPEPWEKKFGKHPTQKPLALLERVLLASSSEGDLVLDPFLGSGTSALAARRRGRKFIGIEIDLRWIRTAANRLRDATERRQTSPSRKSSSETSQLKSAVAAGYSP
jgi:site-specific DNA-methyltransferase (adenine-specific)